jgi:hypothetical protein
VLIIIVAALIGVGLIAAVAVVGLADHGTTGAGAGHSGHSRGPPPFPPGGQRAERRTAA